MRVLIIGGTGFLSSAVTEVCLEAGHAVAVFTRGQRPLPEGVEALTGDRRDYDAFPAHFADREFDAVIDCICYGEADARADVAAFAGRIGHLVLISTDFVYGPRRSLPIREDAETDALTDYGRGKVHAEAVLRDACEQSGIPFSVLRPPHIMGRGGQLGTGTLQGRDPALLSRIEQGGPVFLLDGGGLLIQPVLHRDIARAALAVVGKEACAGSVYNCAGPQVVETREYYETIAQVLNCELNGVNLPSELYLAAHPDRRPFALHRMYEMRALQRDSGYAPQTNVAHCLIEMIDWLQSSDAAPEYAPSPQEARLLAALRSGGEAVLAALRA